MSSTVGRFFRQAAFEQDREQMPQRAEPAQHGRDNGPHQRAVALRQRAEIAAVKQFVERPALPQHATDDIGSDAARLEFRARAMTKVMTMAEET